MHKLTILFLIQLLLNQSLFNLARADLSEDINVQLTSSKLLYDALQRRFVISGRLLNVTQTPVQAPISLVVDGFDSANHSVGLRQPDGLMPDGKPYQVVFPQGALLPGEQANFEFYLTYGNPFSVGVIGALEKAAQKAFKFSIPSEAQLAIEFHLTRVPAGNHQPQADAGVDRVGSVGIAVVLDGGFSLDPNNDPLSFAWHLKAKPQGSQAELSQADTMHPQLTADIPGNYEASLVVSDGYVSSRADTVAIVVSAVPGMNQKPRITSIPPSSWTATMNLNYQVKAGDPDGDALVYRLITAPVGMTLSPSGKLQWSVPDTPDELIPVTLEVDDARGGITAQTFTIRILPCVCS